VGYGGFGDSLMALTPQLALPRSPFEMHVIFVSTYVVLVEHVVRYQPSVLPKAKAISRPLPNVMFGGV
jgi:hypothetical protein